MTTLSDYFRGDNKSGITGPNLAKDVSFADHIVKARGKRTQYTSVSKSPDKIRIFGSQLYKLIREKVAFDKHRLIEHLALMDALREQARSTTKEDRQKAVLALRYARKRLEGLVDWSFDISGVAKKDIITWATKKVQPYFQKQ